MILKISTRRFIWAEPGSQDAIEEVQVWHLFDKIQKATWGRIRLAQELYKENDLCAAGYWVFDNSNEAKIMGGSVPPMPTQVAVVIDAEMDGKPVTFGVCDRAYLCNDNGDTLEVIAPPLNHR